MLLARIPPVSGGRSFVHSLRFELSFILLSGVLAPAALALGLTGGDFLGLLEPLPQIPSWTANRAVVHSVVGTFFCAVGMIVVLRRFRLYPGTAVGGSILPVLASFYGGFYSLIILLRLEYSNQILLLSFVSTLAARYAIETLHFRVKGLFYCLVPGGRVGIVKDLGRTPTLTLAYPSIDILPNAAIIADLHADLDADWERVIAEAAIAGRPVYHYKQVWEAETGKVQIDHLSENSFGALVPSFTYQKLKRLVDLLGCVLALPLVLPIMGVCALLVRMDSPGRVFFLQQRMGFRGKVFRVVKFRTMTEAHDGRDRQRSVTQGDDQRITRIGRFLRKSRLDELPQIYNILRGDMSWIGPRPEAVSLSQWYEAEIPFYRYRHIVRPGITGWAQVNQGHVATLEEVDDKLQYDFYYIKNLSYWLDIIIALRTLRVILSGFGAK